MPRSPLNAGNIYTLVVLDIKGELRARSVRTCLYHRGVRMPEPLDTGSGPVLVSLCAQLNRTGTEVRGIEEFAALSQHLVATGVPLLIFVDAASMNRLDHLASQPHITLVALPESILSKKIAESVASLLSQGKRSPRSTNIAKDTAEYLQLMYLKPWLLNIAAQMCNAQTLWWIDLGIAHVSNVPLDLGSRLNRTQVDPVLIFRDLRPGNRPQSWAAKDGYGFACGGLFGVARDATGWLVETFESHLLTMLAQGEVPLDEDVLTQMALRHPEVITIGNAWHEEIFIGLN